MADQQSDNPNPSDTVHAHEHEHEHANQAVDAADNLPPNTVTVEDAGAARKKLMISIPAERVAAKFRQVYKELHKDAAVPGFRRGRVPQRILEKRFGSNARETIKSQLIAESYEAAVEDQHLNVISQPEMDVGKIELPESGPMLLELFVEIIPEFALPDLNGLEIKKPLLQPTEERFQVALKTLAKNLGSWQPATQPAQPDDRINVAVDVFNEDGTSLAQIKSTSMLVQPGALLGIAFDDLAQRLTGVTPGATVELAGKVPDDFPQEQFRGRSVKIVLHVTGVEHQHIPELDDKLAKENGFDDLADLHAAMRDALQTRLTSEVDRIMQAQVLSALLERTTLDLPAKVSARQSQSVLRRRATELMQRGVPFAEIEKHLGELKAISTQEALRDLKTAFIVNRLAEEFHITITTAQLNSEIAAIATQYGRRPDKLRQELAADGRLEDLAQQVLQRNVLDHVISLSKVVEIEEAAWNELMRNPAALDGGLNVTGVPLTAASSEQNAT